MQVAPDKNVEEDDDVIVAEPDVNIAYEFKIRVEMAIDDGLELDEREYQQMHPHADK